MSLSKLEKNINSKIIAGEKFILSGQFSTKAQAKKEGINFTKNLRLTKYPKSKYRVVKFNDEEIKYFRSHGKFSTRYGLYMKFN